MRCVLGVLLAALTASAVQATPHRKQSHGSHSRTPIRSRKSHSGAGAPTPAAAAPFGIVQRLSNVSGHWLPVGRLQVRGYAGEPKWLGNSRRTDGDSPLFPAGSMVSSAGKTRAGASDTSLPDLPVLGPNGEVSPGEARWVTVLAGGRSLTAPVGTRESYPVVQLTPQVPGSVVRLGQRLPLAVTITNMNPTERLITVSYRVLTASGSPLDSGKIEMRTPAGSRLTEPLSVGPISIPGSITVTVAARDGGKEIGGAYTGGGAVPGHSSVKTSEFPFGLIGGDALLAQAAGVQFWAGGWPWIRTGDPEFGTKGDAAPGSGEGFFTLADRLGIALISSTYSGTPQDEIRYAHAAMGRFMRRAGGWTVPYPTGSSPEQYAGMIRNFYAASKGIHKDATTFLDLPGAAENGIQIGRSISAAGADASTDILALNGMGEAPSSDRFASTVQSVLDLRDTAFPGRPVWDMGEGLTEPVGKSPILEAGQVVRATVEEIAAGVDKVFWTADAGLLRADGTAAPGFFGLSSLSEALAGTEYVGPMPWAAPLRGELFQKNGQAVLVAWSGDGTHQVDLPASVSGALEVRDPMFTRSNLLSLTGRRLTLTPAPVFVTGLGKSLLADTRKTGQDSRFAALKASFDALRNSGAANLPDDLSSAAAGDLLKAAMDAYRPDEPRRSEVLTAVARLLRFWDGDAMGRSAEDPAASLMSADHALDLANRAQADLREELDHREGMRGYQSDMRILLALVEKRLWLARLGLRQKDYPLARAHAEQMALAARELIPYVKAIPVTQLPDPAGQATASR